MQRCLSSRSDLCICATLEEIPFEGHGGRPPDFERTRTRQSFLHDGDRARNVRSLCGGEQRLHRLPDVG